MSSYHDKKYDTDEFEAQMNKEQLLNIYKSFENDDSYYEPKKKKDKKSKAEKKNNTNEKTGKPLSEALSFSNIKKSDEKKAERTQQKKAPRGFVTDENLNQTNAKKQRNEKESDLQFRTPSNIDIEEQDEIAPKTYVVTKEPPAIKVYAVLAVCLCFLVIGGLIYKGISDKQFLSAALPDDNVTSEIASEVDNPDGYIDYQAKMSEVKEPEEIRIVTESRPIGKKDIPALMRVSGIPTSGSVQLEKNTLAALKIMYSSMKQDGVADGLSVYSGYRSYTYQNTQYKSFLKSMKKNMGVKDANACEALAKQLFAKPGTSEHQLGTSVDLCIDKELNQNFLSTDAGRWLLNNAHKYGFIFRYSAEKADYHKRTIEPWHLRYVGVTAAEKMYNENLSLEEYLGIKI